MMAAARDWWMRNREFVKDGVGTLLFMGALIFAVLLLNGLAVPTQH